MQSSWLGVKKSRNRNSEEWGGREEYQENKKLKEKKKDYSKARDQKRTEPK